MGKFHLQLLFPSLLPAPQPLHLQGKLSLFFTAKGKYFNLCVLHCEGLRESCFFPLRGGLAAWLCQGGTVERETNQPVSSQCLVPLSTLEWHLLGLAKLPEPLWDVTVRYALPCLPAPGALAGIMSMKEIENVFIETQVAKSAKPKKVLLSGGDGDLGPLGWTSFCKSQSSVLKYAQPQTTLCVSCRCQDRTPAGETGPKDEYLGIFNVSTACTVPSPCGLGSLSPPQRGGGPVLGQLLIALELTGLVGWLTPGSGQRGRGPGRGFVLRRHRYRTAKPALPGCFVSRVGDPHRDTEWGKMIASTAGSQSR